jgi:hypothetical protein
MQNDQSESTPVAMLIKGFTGLLTGFIGIVYLTLGGIAALAIFGFLYSLLIA